MRKTISILLAVFMLLSIIPVNVVNAEDVHYESVQKLDVVLLNDGQYMIKLPGVDYTGTRQAGERPEINPNDNPDDFSQRTVKVDILEMLAEKMGLRNITFTVTCTKAKYSKDYTVSVDEARRGVKVPVPKRKHVPSVNVTFDDGRDARYAVEAAFIPGSGAVNIAIEYLGHTGVATRWFGNKANRPDVKGNYLGLNQSEHLIDLPKENQNSILRVGVQWIWKGHDNPVYLNVVPESDIKAADPNTAATFKFVIDNKSKGKLASSNYYFDITGDSFQGFTATMREKYTVDFEAGDGTWKTAKPAQQFSANGLKLSETFMDAPDTIGPVTVPNGDNDLTPPTVEDNKPEKVFKGWATTADGDVVDMNTFVITKDTTFYAIYKEKAQGKVAIQYVDEKGNAINDKYKIDGTEYPTEVKGNVGEDVELSKIPEPKFIGYERNGAIDVTGKKYLENGGQTVEVPYKKLADIIPEDQASEDVKKTYTKVTFAADASKGKLKLGNTDGGAEKVYYVNPIEGKTIKDVKNVDNITAEGKENVYKIHETTPWTFVPDEVSSLDTVITTQAVTVNANFVKEKGTVKYEYKYVNTTTITDPSKTDIPAAPTDATEYEVGTTVNAETSVAPKGKTIQVKNSSGTVIGQWTFSGWTPATLTIKKNSSTDKNEFTGTWTFTEAGKQQVNYEFASGTNGETLPNEVTSKLTKQAESKYVNDTVNAPTDTYNAVEITTGSKQGTWTFDGWYAGTTDASKKGQSLTVTEQGPNKFIGVWIFAEKGKKNVTFEFAFYNSKKPTQEIPNNAIGQFKPTLPAAQNNKYVGSDITLPTINPTEVKVDKGDLQGTWKFDGWYRNGAKVTGKPTVSANDSDNKLVGKWILTETETKEVTRVFVIDKNIVGDDKDVPTTHVLPQGVKVQKPNDTTNYLGSTQTPGKNKFNPVEEKIGEKIGKWTFVKWDKDSLVVNADESKNVFTGTWTWTQLTSDKPTVDQPKAEDTVIKGKGKKGSTIVVTTPDGKTHETTVGDNGDWSVTVPPVKENDKIKVEQKEKGKKTSDPVEVTVERKIKYFGHFYEPSPDYLNKGEKPKTHEPKDQTKEKYLEAYRWYVKGNDMGMFMPKKGITRAEVAQMFARALDYDKAMVHVNITPYTDVDANAWYYEAVQKTSAAGIFKGSDKGTFMPTREITKAELIATIARFQHLNTKAGNTMNLQMNHWATSEVEAAYQEGWLDIYTNGTVQFAADEVITRAEVVTILNRAFGRMADAKYIDDNAHTMTNFTDVTKDMWSYYEIMAAANTYLVDKMWVNHATKDNGPETLKDSIEWVRPLIDNKDVREVVEQVRFQR